MDIATTRYSEMEAKRIIGANERRIRELGGDEGGWRLKLLLEEGEERRWNYIVGRVI